MKKDAMRTSLVAGAIGVVLGAASMQAAHELTAYSRPAARDINQQGIENQEARTNDRVDVLRGEGF